MTFEMWFVIAVIVFPLALVLFGRWRVDVAALFMIVALGLAQYLGFSILGDSQSPSQALLAISGFGQPIVITLIGLFILTQALTNNGVMLWLGQRLSVVGANSLGRLVFLFTVTSALLSLLMNNVAVGALLLPSAIQVTRKAKIRPSKLLIPIAFGTALGGMATYFTTANIVISNLLTIARPPQLALGVLSFASVGGLVALAGVVYLTLLGPRLLPNRRPGAEQAIARRATDELEHLYSLDERLWEARISPDCLLVGNTLRQTRIGEKFGLAIIAIWRGRQAIFTPDASERIQLNDVLLLVGREDRVQQLTSLGFLIGRETKSISNFDATLVELILAPHSAYVGKTVKQMNFRRKYGFTVVALLRRGRSYRTDVGELPLEMGDSLLMIGAPERVRDLRINPDIIILEPDPSPRAIPRRRALTSVLVFISAVVLSLAGVPVYLSVLTAALIALLLGLLPIQDAYRAIEWQVIFFIAGLYAASLAMIHTGLAGLIGRVGIGMLGNIGPLGLAATAFLLCAALTQVMGSQATAFVIGPIAISAAIHINANAQAIAVAAAIGCSASFLTPFAHPVNLIMMSPGNYRFGDFFRVGAGLMVVVFLALLLGNEIILEFIGDRMKTLIKNGTLITASDTFQADILIEDEKISRIGLGLEADSAQVVDAIGKLIMPGGIDPHVHLDLPMFDTVSSDDHYTGHKAAAFGGTTTVMDFVPLTQPLSLGRGKAEGDFEYSVDLWMKKAEKAAIDYSFHMNLTKFDDKIAKEIPSLVKNGNHHAQSFHRL